MTVINTADCPIVKGSHYPSPYDEPCRNKLSQALGQPSDLTQFGVNLVRLEPGAWSSQRHWHEHEDEFVWVLGGEVVLVSDSGPETLHAGDCAGFKAGVQDGHHFINESNADVLLLVVGARDERDHGEYSDIDMRFGVDRHSETGGYFETKDGTRLR